MNKTQRVLIIMFLVFTATLLLIGEAKSWRPRWAARRPTAPRTTAPHPTATARHYQYVRAHDYNHDGVVDTRDRLVWIRDRGGKYDTVDITDEDGDLFEAMDINNDGRVDATEIQIFYKMYDTNKNGVLEDAEIDAAVD